MDSLSQAANPLLCFRFPLPFEAKVYYNKIKHGRGDDMVYQGTGTAAGLALAPAFCLAQPGSDSAAASKRSFWDVRAQLKQDYDQSISSLRQAERKDESDILLCHREML